MGVAKDFKEFYEDAKQHRNHIHQQLPYRYFDDEMKIFHNKKSLGIGFKMTVLGGANDDLISSLNKFVMELPQGNKWDYQFTLFGNTQVSHLLEANCNMLSKRGGIVQRLAENQTAYAKYASKNGFFHRQKNHFDLRDYTVHFFLSTTQKDVQRLSDVRESVMTSLGQLGLSLESITPPLLINYVEGIVNFDVSKDRPTVSEYNEFEPINSQVFSLDTEFMVNRKNLSIRHTNI